MRGWADCWTEVRNAVRDNRTRSDAAAAVSAIRGEETTWDALARAWRRMQEGNRETSRADQELGLMVRRDYVSAVDRENGRITIEAVPARQPPRTDRRTGPKHGVIGDTQLRPEDDLSYLRWIARYFADKRPEVVVQLGDWADMASLSSYDSKAKKAVDRRSIRGDFEAANNGWTVLEDEWKKAGYQPERKVYLLGNHEQRIERFIGDNPELAGDINYERFQAKDFGWEVYPFLEPVVIDGVAYAHFFPRGPHGKVTQTKNGAPDARTMVKREMRSCTAGHLQGLDPAIVAVGDRMLRGLILGSSYLHDEDYLSPQGNVHWRGIVLKHSVCDGFYDLCEVPLSYLERKYG